MKPLMPIFGSSELPSHTDALQFKTPSMVTRIALAYSIPLRERRLTQCVDV